ncbi:MAG: DM13 domain-containing protein, partial [Gemmatimonadales bacterium]
DAMGKAHRGSFTGAEGHKARGGFEVVADQGKAQLRLAPDFSVEKGPDVYVVLSNSPKVGKDGSLYLGKLKKFSGEQVYDIPSGTDLSAYSHVVLWCKKYSVAMGSADLASGHDMMHK